MRDKIRNEHIRGATRVVQASKTITEKRLKWYGHVRRMKEEHIVRRMLDVDIAGKSRRCRPHLTKQHGGIRSSAKPATPYWTSQGQFSFCREVLEISAWRGCLPPTKLVCRSFIRQVGVSSRANGVLYFRLVSQALVCFVVSLHPDVAKTSKLGTVNAIRDCPVWRL